MPPAIRDIVTRFLHADMDVVNGVANLEMARDAERREAMVIALADASDAPRIVWSAMLDYLCFDTEPICAECGQPALVYDCLTDGARLPVHRFLCERHAPVGGAAR